MWEEESFECDGCQIAVRAKQFACYICDAKICSNHTVHCKHCKNTYCEKCLEKKHVCENKIKQKIMENISIPKEWTIAKNPKIKKNKKKKTQKLITEFF